MNHAAARASTEMILARAPTGNWRHFQNVFGSLNFNKLSSTNRWRSTTSLQLRAGVENRRRIFRNAERSNMIANDVAHRLVIHHELGKLSVLNNRWGWPSRARSVTAIISQVDHVWLIWSINNQRFLLRILSATNTSGELFRKTIFSRVVAVFSRVCSSL